MRSLCCFAFVTFLAVLSGAAAPTAPAGDDALLALKAAKVLDGLGNTFEPGMVVIKGSKIVSVGTTIAVPDNCRIIDFEDQVICPGFIDLNTHLGAQKDLYEPTSALQTDVCAVDLARQDDPDFMDALRCGITTVVVAPEPRNVISGRATVLKTWGKRFKDRTVLVKGPMVMTVEPSCFKEDRLPTSRMGAVELLRSALRKACDPAPEGQEGSTGDPVIRALVDGRMKAFFFADESYDMMTAVRMAREFGLSLAIVGGTGILDVKDTFVNDLFVKDSSRETKVPIIFGPFDYTTSEHDLLAPGKAAEAGLPIAFASNSPSMNPALLRITAALAVSAGLDKDTALCGVTARAAEICGIASSLGALSPGLDADLAVYSAHPLDLHARLRAVFVNGNKAFEACASCTKKCSCKGSIKCSGRCSDKASGKASARGIESACPLNLADPLNVGEKP